MEATFHMTSTTTAPSQADTSHWAQSRAAAAAAQLSQGQRQETVSGFKFGPAKQQAGASARVRLGQAHYRQKSQS